MDANLIASYNDADLKAAYDKAELAHLCYQMAERNWNSETEKREANENNMRALWREIISRGLNADYR